MEHSMGHFPVTPVVQIHILTAVGGAAALIQYAAHILNASGLVRNDIGCNTSQFCVVCILQHILAHFNGSLMVGNHLHNEIMRNTVVCLGTFHVVDHLIQNSVKTGQVILGTVGKPVLPCHFSSFLLQSGSWSNANAMLFMHYDMRWARKKFYGCMMNCVQARKTGRYPYPPCLQISGLSQIQTFQIFSVLISLLLSLSSILETRSNNSLSKAVFLYSGSTRPIRESKEMFISFA